MALKALFAGLALLALSIGLLLPASGRSRVEPTSQLTTQDIGRR